MRLSRKQLCACAAAVFLALLFPVLTALPVLAEEDTAAQEETAHVYVSVANAGGTALANQEIALPDADGDGVLTVHDAMLAAHDAQFEGGAAAGYASKEEEGGRIATMLWGETAGSFGIYVNHAPVEDLLAPVQSGDLLYAFVCGEADEALYCYFDVSHASVGGEETLTLALTARASGEEAQPVADAVIQIDGRDTAFRTDAEGKVTLQFDGSGSCIVSARKEGVSMLPPVCAVSVGKEEPFAGDRSALFGWILLPMAAVVGIRLALHWQVRRLEP